jgi:hypothetical protein
MKRHQRFQDVLRIVPDDARQRTGRTGGLAPVLLSVLQGAHATSSTLANLGRDPARDCGS